MRRCAVCGKGALTGNTIARRGKAKKEGGVGKKITGITRRRFYPNLQRVKVRFPNGTVKRIRVCVSCLQAGKVTKAPARHLPPKGAADPPSFLAGAGGPARVL